MGTPLDGAEHQRTVTSRPYATEEDLLNMRGLLMEARSRTDDWRYAHVGELMFSYFMVTCHFEPREHIRLWHDGDRLVGYAILGDDPTLDWQVLPEYEWSGIESEALAWGEAFAAELRAGDPDTWGPLVSGARADNARRIAFLDEHGFRYRGEFAEVNHICSLTGRIAEPQVPAGYQVRAVSDPDEIPDRAAAHRDVWLPWTDGMLSDHDYARMTKLPGYDPDLDVVAVAPDGRIAAFVNGWLDPENRIGDLGEVGARPAYRRLGLTRAVLLECMRRMRGRGMDRACVSTGESNSAARPLYESIRFQVENRYLDFVKRD